MWKKYNYLHNDWICHIKISLIDQYHSIYDTSKFTPDTIRRLESNAFKKVFPNRDFLNSKISYKVKEEDKKDGSNSKQAIQNLAVKEGESLSGVEIRALAKKTFDNQVNKHWYIDAIKTSFFNGFRVN